MVSVDVEKTTIELEGGETVSADLIIAADGVHSVIRPHIVDTSRFYPTASTGHNALRFMVSKSTVQNDSILGPIVDDNAHMFTWASKKEHTSVSRRPRQGVQRDLHSPGGVVGQTQL